MTLIFFKKKLLIVVLIGKYEINAISKGLDFV